MISLARASSVREVFVVTEYAAKRVKGPRYDVAYEDTGDVQTIDPTSYLR